MNKKGFTLVEIIVSVALLALIGVIVGISLNSTIKKQQISSYEEYVEKVKSSALLYINNTPSIINELNDNYSYKILEARDVISNGYLNENLIDPSTKEKINQNDKIKAYYDENYELMIDYPYENNNGENYLYTRNYNAIYNSDERNLCYIGINTNELQIINSLTGLKVGDNLISYNENETKANIIAYMEDGRLCTDEIINTSKIGSYKIRYTYTIDGTPVSSSNNKKTAERTITIKPSKPKINSFDIISKYDNEYSYEGILTYDIEDKSETKLSYCLTITNDFSSCNNKWKEVENKKLTKANNQIINLINEFPELKNKAKTPVYLFVKNEFEEYTSSNLENIFYTLSASITLDANGGYFNVSGKTSTKVFENVFNHEKQTTFENFINSNSAYKTPVREGYTFLGWGTNKSDREIEYTNNSSQILTGNDKTIYAKWKDTTFPICTIAKSNLNTTGGVTVTVTCKDKESGCKEASHTYTGVKSNQTYTVYDNEGNSGTCSVTINVTTDTNTCINGENVTIPKQCSGIRKKTITSTCIPHTTGCKCPNLTDTSCTVTRTVNEKYYYDCSTKEYVCYEYRKTYA